MHACRSTRCCGGSARCWTAFAPGGVLTGEPNGRDGFLQVILTARGGEWREVELGLPDADWSRASFDRALRELPPLAMEWLLERTPGNPDVPRFLRLRVDARARTAALLHAATDILGFPPAQTYRIELHGSDHPDSIRETVAQIANLEKPRFTCHRAARLMRAEADRIEQAMRSAAAPQAQAEDGSRA